MSEYIVDIIKEDGFDDFRVTNHGRLIRCRECRFFDEWGAAISPDNKAGACSNKAGLSHSIVFWFDFCSNALPAPSRQEGKE